MKAQTFKAYLDAAENALIEEDYYSALTYYGNALQFEEDNAELRYKYAETAQEFHSYSLAEQGYLYVIAQDSTNEFPMATYRLAQVQQKLGKYEESKRNYELFQSEYTGRDEGIRKNVEKELLSVDWAIDHIAKVGSQNKVERLSEDINTTYSEFGAIKDGDTLYFSSLRFEDVNPDFDPNRTVAKILKSGNYSAGEVIENGGINNNNRTVAHTSFTPDKDQIYYTICEYKTASDLTCQLYYRNIDSAGIYGEPMPLPNFINSPQYTSTQPNVAYDAENDELRLYYVSDKPLADGTENGLDIYYTVIRENGGFTEPVNLRSVNTMGNEITPFYHTASNTLFFSSDADLRLGGYDIFKSVRTNNSYGQRINLGAPVNSSYNDVYYTLSVDSREAHFSSNRLESNYIDGIVEACCYDIYRADIKPNKIIVNALTFEELSRDSLPGSMVRLLDGPTMDPIEAVENFTGIDHVFELESEREYIFIAEKPGYIPDTMMFSTYNVNPADTIIKKLFLEKTFVTLNVEVFERGSNDELAGALIIVEDLSDPDNPSIQKINYNGNDFEFNLERGKQYKITAIKDGYEKSSILVDTSDPNFNEDLIRKIYLSKDNTALYGNLPLELYFDNDEPDKASFRLYTLRNYTDTYYPYMSRKNTFKEQRQDQAAQLEDFFEKEVKGGYADMLVFLNALLNRLSAGESYELSVMGYTSPRSNNKYNLALGRRRVFSVKNELRDYQAGALSQYLDNGQLTIKDVSFGEELAPGFISDSIGEEDKSIYSLEASKERKVMIVDLKQINNLPK